MPQTVEIDYFSRLLAALIVTTARATDARSLMELHDELVGVFTDVFALISHDADLSLPDALMGRLEFHSVEARL